MQLSCPSCNASIPAKDVNIARLVAKCAACDELFAFERPLTRAGGPPPRPPRLVVEPDEPPTHQGSTYRSAPAARPPLVIKRRRFEPTHLGLLLFCVFWDGFLVLWYTIAFAGDGPLIILIFPLIHVAIGIGLTYYTFIGLLNTTTFRVENGVLSVRDAPLPWFGNLALDRHVIRRLYMRAQRGKKGTTPAWALQAETKGGAVAKIFSGLTREEANYLEWALEEHLGLRDEHA